MLGTTLRRSAAAHAIPRPPCATSVATVLADEADHDLVDVFAAENPSFCHFAFFYAETRIPIAAPHVNHMRWVKTLSGALGAVQGWGVHAVRGGVAVGAAGCRTREQEKCGAIVVLYDQMFSRCAKSHPHVELPQEKTPPEAGGTVSSPLPQSYWNRLPVVTRACQSNFHLWCPMSPFVLSRPRHR